MHAATGGAWAEEGCGLKQFASIDTLEASDGRILVPVVLDGKPLNFLLDTGASESALFSDTAERLQLQTRPMQHARLSNVEGHSIDRYVTGKTFTLGGRTVESRSFVVFPRNGAPDDAASGLLGADFLSQFDLEIDPVNHRIRLFSQDHCPGRAVYWADAYVDVPLEVNWFRHIFVSAELNGQKLRALLDTGASQVFLSIPAAEAHFGLTTASPGVTRVTPEAASASSDMVYYRARLDTLSIEGIAMRNPTIFLLPDKLYETLGKDDFRGQGQVSRDFADLPELTIGTSVLQKLHLYIAYGEKRLYATAANAH
ncbi:MAG TPA: retropepsin-like aspartic protease [Aliidongia sp.]|nr:retropepsin-like aspartic protease [Aliidongia sp.]